MAALDISQITEYLFISAWPVGAHVAEVKERGIGLILSMHWIPPFPFINDPDIRLVWLPTIDTPFTPMPIPTLVRGVEAALPFIRANGKVLTHCRAGVHRSVAMACCVLIAMGFSVEDAMQKVKEMRKAADPEVWYIKSRIRKFDNVWKTRL